MIQRIPNRDDAGSVTIYVPLYYALLAMAIVLMVCVIALGVKRSLPCADAISERNELQSRLMRAEHDNEILEPFAMVGLGLIDADSRRAADWLATHGAGRNTSLYRLTEAK